MFYTVATVAERLKKRSTLNPATGCLLFIGATDRDGYGQINIGGKTKQAHFAAWEDKHGAVPEGLEIDHTCEQRACVNVEHLEAVTHAENVRRISVRAKKRKGIEDAEPMAIDPVEAQLMAKLRIDPAKCEGFRLDDLSPHLARMLAVYG